MDNIKILAIVGMSGSGKSVAVDYLTGKGYPKVYFGAIKLRVGLLLTLSLASPMEPVSMY